MSTNKQRREDAMRSLDKEIKSRDRAEKTKPLGVAAAAAVALLVIVSGIYFAATNTNEEDVTAESTTSTTRSADSKTLSLTRETPLADTVSCSYPDAGTASKEISKPQTENISTKGTVTVTLTTNQGDIPMELDRSVAPCTVNAIEHFANNGYYDDTICHRLTTSGIFVLQCGDPSGTGAGGPGFSFANEYPTDEAADTSTPVTYPRGSIAMANAGADTNGSQFFLNYQDSPLAPSYTYFGQVTDSGLNTLDAIADKGTANGGGDGSPAEEVRITKVSVTS
ncbi:peptidylprolyl isomerase [Corynebacterium kutscheri]|nr:peptidylprolyl isomerase [Corynebacterium kutscheri]